MSDLAKSIAQQGEKPWKSPTYPQRVHIREKAHWQGVLRSWEEKIAQFANEMGPNPTPVHQRTYAQMLGARDQIADAAVRLPLEVGDLYEEDKHKLEEAVASLERMFAR